MRRSSGTVAFGVALACLSQVAAAQQGGGNTDMEGFDLGNIEVIDIVRSTDRSSAGWSKPFQATLSAGDLAGSVVAGIALPARGATNNRCRIAGCSA